MYLVMYLRKRDKPMCELFALNAEHAVGARYSLLEFARHGGLTHKNSSGWGISFQRKLDTILIKEAEPAFDSPWVRFVSGQHILSKCMIAHIRHASHGQPSHANTHPFVRELGGRSHVFVHNGSLQRFAAELPLRTRRFLPIGETDSEHAFCFMLEQLAPLWDQTTPSLARRMAIVVEAARAIRNLGPANFFYFDSDTLFVHSDQRRYEEDGACAPPRAPGLHWIKKSQLHVPGLKITPQAMARTSSLLIASVPLSDDPWTGFERGTVAAIADGNIQQVRQL